MEFQQKCYFPGGNTLSFSDGDSKSRYRMGLTCHFAMLDPNVKIPPLVRAMHFGKIRVIAGMPHIGTGSGRSNI